MVQTRLSTKLSHSTPAKKLRKTTPYKGKKVSKNFDFERCKSWIQQQKKEKPKCLPDEINSDDDGDDEEEERQQSRMDNISDTSMNEIAKVCFACEWQRCNHVFVSYIDLQQHVLAHLSTVTRSSDKSFKCEWDLCDYECDNSEVLNRHVGFHVYMTNLKTTGEQLLQKKVLPPCINNSRRRNLIPDTESRYVCNWKDCNCTFDMPQEFFDHTRFHCIHELEINKVGHRNQTVQCKWVSCKKTFNKRLKMTDHMRTHTGERFVACPNCGSTFQSYVKFYDHYRRQGIRSNFKCGECLQLFNTAELLNNHMHGHINRHKCTMCDMTCPSPAALTQHFRYRHLKERPYKCLHCDYGAVTKYDMSKHVRRMHSVEQEPEFCTEFGCEYTCLTPNMLRKHMNNVHGDGPRVYCCHCCNQHYKNGSSLSKHLIKNHGFQLPSGHRRFTYHIDTDGVYRVQTTRTESLEVSEQIIAPPPLNLSKIQNISYEIGPFLETPTGLIISVDEVSPSKEMKKVDARIVNVYNGSQNVLETISEQLSETTENDIETIDSNRFMESLNLKQLLPSKRTENGNKNNNVVDTEFKDIGDFSVIQKYAKKKRPQTRIATLTIQDLDADGNILHSETKNIRESDLDSYTR